MIFGVLFLGIALTWTILLIIGIYSLQLFSKKPLRLHGFPYSTAKYYLLLSPLWIAFVVTSILFPDPVRIIYFIVSAFVGMAGETLFSWYWDTLYEKRFWIYQVKTVFHSYTSWLNLIPWAFGGFLYLGLAHVANYSPTLKELIVFWCVFIAFAIIVFLSRVLVHRNDWSTTIEFKSMSWINYFFAMSPMIGAIVVTGLVYQGSRIYAAAFLFGIIAFIAEYLFGKTCESHVSKRLWIYTYGARDRGHITPLSIIPFSFGGFFFITLFVVIKMFIEGIL